MMAVKLHTQGAGQWLQNYIQIICKAKIMRFRHLSYAVLWGTDAELNFLLKNALSLVNEPVAK